MTLTRFHVGVIFYDQNSFSTYSHYERTDMKKQKTTSQKEKERLHIFLLHTDKHISKSMECDEIDTSKISELLSIREGIIERISIIQTSENIRNTMRGLK